MEENLSPDQIKQLKEELSSAKFELQDIRQKQNIVQVSSQDRFLEILFDKGGEIFKEFTKMSSETQKHVSDQELALKKEELIVITKLDTKEKIYKGILIIICISALVLSALFIEKAEAIIPVLSLIIGLLFKANSLSDFFSHKQKNIKEDPY